MKKFYLLSGMLLSVASLFSQPVITDTTNFPSAGFTVPLSIGTAPGGPGTAGAAQTWDFTALSLSVVGTQVFQIPSATPYFAGWPTSNLGFYLTNPGPTLYQYLLASSGKLEFLATEITTGPGSGNDYLPNPQTILKFPFNYGDTISDVYQKVGFPADNFLLTYDGYGTLMMPGGYTYTNVARIKFAYSGGNDYVFWSTNPLMPLVIYNYTGNAVKYFGAPSTAIDNENLISYSVYPNPATHELRINSVENISAITCFSASGNVVKVDFENNIVDISGLSNGLYHLVITTMNNEQGIASFTKQ